MLLVEVTQVLRKKEGRKKNPRHLGFARWPERSRKEKKKKKKKKAVHANAASMVQASE